MAGTPVDTGLGTPHGRRLRARLAILVLGLIIVLTAGTTAATAGQGEVVARHDGIPATFTGGPQDFTVLYDIRIVTAPAGTFTAVFEQQGSPDVLRGKVNTDGVPPKMVNPGLEKMTGGRIRDGVLSYTYYEYISGGQKDTWSSVVFDLPPDALPFPAPAPPEPPEGTSTPTPTPSPAETQTPDPTPAVAADEGGGGSSTGVVVAVVAVGVAGGLAATMVRKKKKKKSCEDEKERWEAAERAYDAALESESRAQHDREMQQIAADRAARERLNAKNEVLGEHVETSTYTEAMAEWEAMAPGYDARVEAEQAKLEEATEAAEDATQRREQLDAERREAKRLYEECIGHAAQATAGAETSSGGTAIATAPGPLGPTQTRGCKDTDPPRNERYFGRSSVQLVIDFQVRATPTGTARGHYQDADELAASLTEIAEILEDLGEGKLPGKAGELQELRDQAKSLADKAKTLRDKGAGELLKSEIEGAVKEQVNKVNEQLKGALNEATGLGDAWGAATKVPDLLKEPYKIPIEILKMTAELGAMVALFGGKVVRENDMYKVEARVQTLQIDILWRSVERCRNGRWVTEHEVITANGPTEWQAWQQMGEYPGRATGRGLDDGLGRAFGWCQSRMNMSTESLSQAINTPPKG